MLTAIGVPLCRIQKHHRALRARMEARLIARAVLAQDADAVVPLEVADPASPLTAGWRHGRIVEISPAAVHPVAGSGHACISGLRLCNSSARHPCLRKRGRPRSPLRVTF